ncbi:MAG: PhoH family protein [Legionellaceae bacterium]|nr:PhoH family protein [Legionellaceae bacterium]
MKKSFPLRKLNQTQQHNIVGHNRGVFRYLEKTLAVHLALEPNNVLTITSDAHAAIQRAHHCIQTLSHYSHQPIHIAQIKQLLQQGEVEHMTSPSIKLGRKTITARNQKQQDYLNSIDKNAITIAVGPAGTGKTWLAVAKAIESFERGEVQRLVFVRPAVEAGEKLGFLPGDLVEKVLPYLRPVYDALYEMLGFKETQKLIQSDVIEILPLAFMRGRTLNEAFIILDEAQNTTSMQMKMFVTRMGFSSRMVINGDMTQIDLPKGTRSGLKHATTILQGIPEIGIYRFTNQEVVRHPLISQIIDCYDKDEAKPDA